MKNCTEPLEQAETQAYLNKAISSANLEPDSYTVTSWAAFPGLESINADQSGEQKQTNKSQRCIALRSRLCNLPTLCWFPKEV